MAQVGRVHSRAGQTFRDAADQAERARPAELSDALRGGRATTSVPAQESVLAPIREETRTLVNSGRRTTEADELGRAEVTMDALMERIGHRIVPATNDMVDLLQNPDVQGALPAILRRRVNAALDAGEDLSGVDIPVSTWEMVRKTLADKVDAGAGQLYKDYRNQVRDYVGAAVKDYGEGLKVYGLTRDFARGVKAGRSALTQDTQEFAAMLRTAGGGTADVVKRPESRGAIQAGARIGARNALANLFNGPEKQVEKVMARVANDPRLRANLRAALSANEMASLERLGERYGRRLDLVEGVREGNKVLQAGDAERFRDAVENASGSRAGRVGVETGTRGTIVGAAKESPEGALRVATSLADDPGLQSRLEAALGGEEASRMVDLGTSATYAARRLRAAVPGGTQAQTRSAETARGIQQIIMSSVVATGRFSGAFLANLTNGIVQRVNLSKKAAAKLAELATDPEQAPLVIEKLIKVGYNEDDILRLYRDAAVASGILTGTE
jgi:hypothetical protein